MSEVLKKELVKAFDQLLAPARNRLRTEAQESRVQALIRQMGQDEEDERRRLDAARAAENGDPTAQAYLKVEPTAEFLSHGQFETVQARLLHQHDIRTTTKRRVHVIRVVDLYNRGVIDAEGLTTCRWYKDCWEATGLIGLIPSTDYSKEVFAAPQSRDMFNAHQLDALEKFRFAQAAIGKRYVAFFEAVVLKDCGVRNAIKLAGRRRADAVEVFKDCLSELETAYEKLKGV